MSSDPLISCATACTGTPVTAPAPMKMNGHSRADPVPKIVTLPSARRPTVSRFKFAIWPDSGKGAPGVLPP